jgi:serine/threonine protein kinase
VSQDAVVINGYRLVNLLMTGQHSQVWEVEELYTGRHYALKILLPEAAAQRIHRRMMANEARVGMQLDHPNIIKTFKYFADDEAPHLIMELFPASNLRLRILRQHPVIYECTRQILEQAALALDYMHQKGFVHRDVKPDNILVSAAGDVRLIDFALAARIGRSWGSWFRRGQKVQGTRSYMSPEQIRGKGFDPRADIYSFGCTVYELITGRPPFRADSPASLLAKHLHEKPRPMRTYNENVSEALDQLVLRMLAKDPEDRPQSMHEVVAELRRIPVWKTPPKVEQASS